MSADRIESFGRSLIQHGPANDRIYLMKLGEGDAPEIPVRLTEFAKDKGYTKIFAKVPAVARPMFTKSGFVEEARIPGLFQRKEDGFFLSKFMSVERETEKQSSRVAEILKASRQKAGKAGDVQLTDGHVYRMMRKCDATDMAQLYRQVFESYPFPIHDPDYLVQTMNENLIYFGIWADNRLIALSSAEVDFDNKNAEMTDFATLPDFRGMGLASYLLGKMDSGVRQIGIKTAYTIARAYSFGMNITFAKQGYLHGGTLTNNTQISGSLESMNVWYKHL
ncbi:putative beta-lysine N-acetyltransferase [Geothermobacter hydrogeniphilus]|uniref:Putative beta-lysine N-acetyltransferase n=1 Tax=Geothermobacter hydrogeniphilus TaxID=1969733 RepID=A0A2K2HCU0_9BACT|nr:putative beta-lysine N-acetyltransferase [Geothermobacter hydrogeniphilus]PNU21079.1 putative beta-lysine N-acetyltransferase [Geothermobacter hydrogeniphilus]